tara:strand:- start:1799 stop:1993 length:195 start_codon:yes stop_codon:yes gene_type:complete
MAWIKEEGMMDFFTTWISILTILFVLESSLLIYFVHWILWRWNGPIQDVLVAHYSNSESDKEEE